MMIISMTLIDRWITPYYSYLVRFVRCRVARHSEDDVSRTVSSTSCDNKHT